MALSRSPKKNERCAYQKCCYLADALRCFGYKTDCVLYLKSNGESYNETRFHDAMNSLINKTKAKYEKLPV